MIQRIVLKNPKRLAAQSILSSRFLCLSDALNFPMYKNTAKDIQISSPKNRELKSTICFEVWPKVLAFQGKAILELP